MSLLPTAKTGASGPRRTTMGRPRQSMASSMTDRRASGPRQSTASRRMSTINGKSGGRMVDPRPMSDKGYQLECIHSVINYMTMAGYPKMLSTKELTAPSSTTLKGMVEFLIQRIDPHYTFDAQKWDEDIVMWFKRLKYPLPIPKSSLKAPGASHVWPQYLGALVWLVEEIKYNQESEEIRESPAVIMDEAEKALGDRDVFNFMAQSYRQWLEGEDDTEVLEAPLREMFAERSKSLEDDVAYLTAETEALEKTLHEYTSNPSPLVVASEKRAALQSDAAKFRGLIQKLESQKKALTEGNLKLRSDIREKDIEQSTAEGQKASLEARVQAQEISAADVERMVRERMSLEESVANVEATKSEVQQQVWEAESSVNRKLEESQSLVRKYNTSAHRLHLAPRTAKHAGGNDNEVTFVATGNTYEEMLSNADMKIVLRPACVALKEHFISQLAAVGNKKVELGQKEEMMLERIDEHKEELSGLEDKIARAEASFKAEREAGEREVKSMRQDCEDIETDIASIRAVSTADVGKSEQSVKLLSAELSAARKAWGVDRDKCKQVLASTLDFVADHQMRVRQTLEGVQSRAIAIEKANK